MEKKTMIINGIECEYESRTLTQLEAMDLGLEIDKCPLCGEVHNLKYTKTNGVWDSCKCDHCLTIIWTVPNIDVYGIDACINGVNYSKYDTLTFTQKEYLEESIKNKLELVGDNDTVSCGF